MSEHDANLTAFAVVLTILIIAPHPPQLQGRPSRERRSSRQLHPGPPLLAGRPPHPDRHPARAAGRLREDIVATLSRHLTLVASIHLLPVRRRPGAAVSGYR